MTPNIVVFVPIIGRKIDAAQNLSDPTEEEVLKRINKLTKEDEHSVIILHHAGVIGRVDSWDSDTNKEAVARSASRESIY